MTTITLTLTSYNMGDATESDFDSWVSFVSNHIGDDVNVESDNFGTAGGDRIEGADDEQLVALRELLGALWEDWCSAGDLK